MGTFPAISTSNVLIISEADCSTFSRKRPAGESARMTEAEPAEMGLAEAGLAPSKGGQTQKGRCPKGFGQRPEGKDGASVEGGRPRKAAREGRPAPKLGMTAPCGRRLRGSGRIRCRAIRNEPGK